MRYAFVVLVVGLILSYAAAGADEDANAALALAKAQQSRLAVVEGVVLNHEDRLARLERAANVNPYKGGGGVATASEVVTTARDGNGNYWNVTKDGKLEWCSACNQQKPAVATPGVVAQAPFDPTGLYNSGRPHWQAQYPTGVTTAPAYYPMGGSVQVMTSPSGVTSAGASTSTGAGFAGRRGIIKSMFRPARRLFGGWGGGGC